MHVGLKDEILEERYRTLTSDEAELLYNPLPQDLPTVKKTLLTQMAAYDGNIERYARLAMSGRTLTSEDQDCVIRGIRHHSMYARWWADQIKNDTVYARSCPHVWELQSAIAARRIMLNDLSIFSDGWPSGVPMPYVIWSPLRPHPEMLQLLVEKVPEMKTQAVAAAIVCDYDTLYEWFDPEPSWHLWKVASMFSTNPFYREDQERRAKEKSIRVNRDKWMDTEFLELMRTREVGVHHGDCAQIQDSVGAYWVSETDQHILNTTEIEFSVWRGIGKVTRG